MWLTNRHDKLVMAACLHLERNERCFGQTRRAVLHYLGSNWKGRMQEANKNAHLRRSKTVRKKWVCFFLKGTAKGMEEIPGLDFILRATMAPTCNFFVHYLYPNDNTNDHTPPLFLWERDCMCHLCWRTAFCSAEGSLCWHWWVMDMPEGNYCPILNNTMALTLHSS